MAVSLVIKGGGKLITSCELVCIMLIGFLCNAER
jgi:hypothetical protein